MPVPALYNETRERFPELTAKADREHIKYWGELDPEFAYSWFESLATALNAEMSRKVPARNYAGIFRHISSAYGNGDSEVQNCIDVAFTENLFWQVKGEKAGPYWELLPSNLKELYVGFHGKIPL